jgi:hypothetical protein
MIVLNDYREYLQAYGSIIVAFHPEVFRVLLFMFSQRRARYKESSVTEPTNYTKLSKKIIHQADDLINLSPYNPIVREIATNFKPTYIPAKIIISLAVTITSYIKVHVTNTSEFKYSYYEPSSNKSSGSI